MSEPATALLSEAYARALFDAARALGRCEKAAQDIESELVELRGFVNEQLAVNYRDHDERIKLLETRAAQQRASWKTITALVAAVTGGSGFVSLLVEWLRARG
jgi:hypothetical protein